MKKICSKIFIKFFNFLKNSYKFVIDFIKFKKMSVVDTRFLISFFNLYPCLDDNFKETNFDTHYIYHPAWATRIVKKINPKKHIDISSSLTFCTMLSAFIPTDFYDFRPAKLNLSNLVSKQANLTNLFFKSNSIESISCMHTIEHIGLGRYGDELDPTGDIKAINELKRVVKKKGHLLIVVPIGKPKIYFNAHRVYSFDQIISYFPEFILNEFSLVTDNPKHKFLTNPSKKICDSQKYGCGCFHFIKL